MSTSFRVRVRNGAVVWQDFRSFRWPPCKAHEDIVFRCTQDGCGQDNFKCVAVVSEKRAALERGANRDRYRS